MWLLVGGSGFIGINFAHFLQENDYDFMIYDIHRSPYLSENFKTVIGDIRDKKKMSVVMKDCDIIFHLATVPPSQRISRQEIYNIEIKGTQNLLSLAEKNGVKRIVFTSSASHVYGPVNQALCLIQEDCLFKPINEYGRNKVIAEGLCQKAAETTDLQCIILRLSMVLGPYNFDPILVENFFSILNNKKVIIPGDGKNKNQCIHVQDVNTALLACAEISDASFVKHDVFNIAGTEALTINEWMELTKRVCHSSSKVMHLPLLLAKGIITMAWWLHQTKIHPSYFDLLSHDQHFDISKAKKILKWEPQFTIEEALEDSIKFFKKEIYH